MPALSEIPAALSQNISAIFAGVLVALYAWRRYGTPRHNRCSTTFIQFYTTCCAYVLCALAIFLLLTMVLEQPGALAFLTFGVALPEGTSELSVAKLSTPFVAALLLTTLLPSIPFMREIDGTLLKFFQRLGSIPVEVSQLRGDLQEMAYTPLASTQERVRRFLEPYPNIVLNHLAFGEGSTIEHTFTRSLCLYCELRQLDKEAPFLTEFAEDAAELNDFMALVCAQAGGYFTFADLALAEPASDGNMKGSGATGEAVKAAGKGFRKICETANEKIHLLYARGLLNASWSGHTLRQRLRSRGFTNVIVHAPIVLNHILTAGMIVFSIFIVGMFLLGAAGKTGTMDVDRRVTLAFVISLNYCVAAALAIMPKRWWASAKRTADGGRSVMAYLVSALLTGVAAIVIGIVHTCLWEGSPGAGIARYFSVTYPWIAPPVVVALVLAILCDDFALEKSEPAWLRWAEGLCTGLAVTAATFGASAWFRQLLSEVERPIKGVAPGGPPTVVYTAILIGVGIAIGLTLGALVPYAYRMARRAEEAIPPAAAAPPVRLVSA